MSKKPKRMSYERYEKYDIILEDELPDEKTVKQEIPAYWTLKRKEIIVEIMRYVAAFTMGVVSSLAAMLLVSLF